MKTEVKLRGVDGVLNTLKSLPAEVVSVRGGPVKLALAKGARVILAQAKQNLRAAIAVNGDESTGLLEKNVVVTRGKAPSSGKGERYLVRVRRKQYPKGGQAVGKGKRSRGLAKAGSTLQTANLLEYGSSHQPATQWLRPAVTQKGEAAIHVMTEDLLRRVDVIVRKLAQKNGGK